jgi:Protein of unknown function (DUF1573)/Metallo-peptidase family M12B Reprolysin-like
MNRRIGIARRTAAHCTSSAANSKKIRTLGKRRLQFESLELRALLTSSNLFDNAFQPQLSHGGLCTCPICTGRGLDQIPAIVAPLADPSASSPLSSLPQLHSNPLATAKLFLDFDGHFEASWGSYSNVSTPAFDQDGNGASFSAGELASMNEIWARVSEDYAPFNIDVTTVDPGTQADRLAAVIAVGGSSSDWYNGSAGGVAYVGGFFNGGSNVGYAFADNLGGGNPKYVAEAAAHEAGHLFGLEHQAVWNGSTLVAPYNSGDSNWAPLMGVGYYASRTTWYNGPTPNGPTAFQDDLAILAGANNGFGYQPDDYGDSIAAASSLPASGGNVNLSGLIGRNGDADYWSFSTAGGAVNFQLSVAAYGPNLDAVLELRDSTGQIIVTAAPATSQGASISTTLGAGTYYLSARSNGDYGDLGQYTITGSVVGLIAAPEITIKEGATSLSDGQTVNFGSTTTGAPITQSFTIANDGTATLTLSSLTSVTLPGGFSLASDLGSLSLSAGQSTTFSLRLNATAAGTFSGTIQIANNDSDENPFDLTLTGTVTASNSPVILDNGQAGYAEAGSGWQGWPTGYNGSVRYNSAGPNGATASWQQTGLTAGNYQVQATWNAASNHTGSAVYQIYDGTTLRQTITVDQRPNPSGASFGGVLFQTLGTVLVNSGALRVVLSNSASGDVVADAVRIVSTSPPPSPTVDLNWSSGGLSGVPATATVQTPFTINRSYSIANTVQGSTTASATTLAYYSSVDAVFGNADDVLLGSETLPVGQGASVYSGTSPALQVAAAGTYYVFAKLDDGSALPETDETNNVTQAAQQVTVVVVSAPSSPIILDNGQTGYTETGSGWQGWPTGYNGSVRYNSAGPNGATASWQQTGLAAGNYQVQATWNAAPNHTGSAVYQIYDGTTLRQTVTVDQRPNPSGASFGGVLFQTLGTVLVNSGALRVVLSNSASGDVVADAVRIVPPPTPTVDLNWSSGGLSGVPVTATVQTPFTISRTYTNANTTPGGTTPSASSLAYYSSVDAVFGNADDVLLGSEPVPAGQAAGTYSGTSPALQFAAAGTYYVFAKLDDGSALPETDETNNVTPAAQQVTVVVVSAPSNPIILDNGQAGYAETGAGWQGWPTGYNGGVRYNSAGPNGATASWQQTGLTAGNYQVQATWNGSFNHTSSAVYQIYDGTTLRQTITVDQRPDPSGASFGGVLFQTLGTVLVNSGALRVVLSNSASGDIVADAVRIVPL